jgi:hypothetical protein
MNLRRSATLLLALPVLMLSLVLAGCNKVQSISIQPESGSVILTGIGQTVQFKAIATEQFGSAPSTTSDITTTVTWSVSNPSVATINASGIATAIGQGYTQITAESNGITAASDLTVNIAGTTGTTGGTVEPLISLTIVPDSITVGNLQDTGQFLAIGTFATAPYVRDLTNSPTLTWISSVPSVFTVNTNTAGSPGATAGTVTAYGSGNAVIIAEATSSDGTIQTATATFNCPLVLPTPTSAGSCYPGSQAPALLATLTVYNEGLNTTNWLVTAPSATGTPSVLHCGPGSTTGGSVCVATYPVGTTVTLTAPATGAAFGGWSYNCTQTVPAPPAAPSAVGPNSCKVTLTTNDTVGAIFN